MLGTIVNALAIIGGSIIGLLFKGGIPERISETVMNGLALCVFFIGFSGAFKVNNLLLVIISIVIGAILGEIIDIDKRLQSLGNKIESSLKGKGGRVSEAFVTASLLFCVGAMAIVGSLESGLAGKHDTLFAKSMLDGVTSILFTSSLGIGVMFSAVSVFLYQGAITLGATYLRSLLTTTVIQDMSAAGGLLIIALGLNMLKITKIKVGNLLPAIFIPLIYELFKHIF